MLPILASAILATGSASACLPPEPASVSLQGILERVVFPGPPNYESVAGGDTPETSYVITLDRAVCLAELPNNPTTRIQLVFLNAAEQSYTSLAPLLRSRVSCSGSLFARESGHHHTPVLLTVATCAASN